MTDRWPWEYGSDADRRMFNLVRAYMDYHDLWYHSDGERAIKAVSAMTDEEAQALLAMRLLDRTVNK